jgi:hypothetical protein
MEFVANVTNLVPLDIDFLTKYIRRLFSGCWSYLHNGSYKDK